MFWFACGWLVLISLLAGSSSCSPARPKKVCVCGRDEGWFYKSERSEDVQIFVAPTAFSSLPFEIFVPGREPRAPSVASLRSLRKSARPKTLTTSVSAPELRRQCFGKTSSFGGLWGCEVCEVRTRVCVGVWESSSVSNDLTVETLLGFCLQLRRQGQGHRRRRCRKPMTLLHLALHLSIQKLTCWFRVPSKTQSLGWKTIRTNLACQG